LAAAAAAKEWQKLPEYRGGRGNEKRANGSNRSDSEKGENNGFPAVLDEGLA
jgi:hypothetical protein